ncbi:hypothetical protein SAY87_027853 [Trapa incisa]|uniref:Wall-associated receptor kinase C-terminal domain-containing protein n=1 Tax=Trapa incisa TaxID=236973 RepID=A0AAN7QN06_9MYRT|nr:hypothetical protein SAY87_027853 [Trapa incisa]
MMIGLCSLTSIITLYSLYHFHITSMILIQVRASLGSDAAQYTYCSSTIQCGTLKNISYPFCGVNRADYCGRSSEFHLISVDNTSLQITISDLTYRVLIQVLHFSSDTLPTNLTLNYGCSTSTSTISLFLDSTSQMGNSITLSYLGNAKRALPYQPTNQLAVQGIEGSTSTQTGTTALEVALEQGFVLQWAGDTVTGLCQLCITSGGRCGRNIQNLSKFTCYCSDNKAYSSTCGGQKGRCLGQPKPAADFISFLQEERSSWNNNRQPSKLSHAIAKTPHCRCRWLADRLSFLLLTV